MLDPQTKAILKAVIDQGIPSVSELTPQEAREAYIRRRQLTQPDSIEVGEIRDFEIEGPGGSLPVRSYKPDTAQTGLALPALVYFHGGGFVIGAIETHDSLCRQLCNESGCAIFSVEYRLAPEHPYPAAAQDCIAATRWIGANAKTLGIDVTRLAVGGDSAGGQLAAVTSIALRDDPQIKLAFQLLIYPVTDALMQCDSITRNGAGYMLTKENLEYYYGHYLPDPQTRREWQASPLHAPDLSNLPSAFVLTAGYDPLHDEGLAYADALSQAGVPTHYVCFSRQIHGFLPMGKVIDEANLAVSVCAAALRRALNRG